MLSVICHTTTSMKATSWHKRTLVDGQVVFYTTSVAGALTDSNSPHSKLKCHQSYPVIYLPFKPVTPWSLNSLWDVSVFKAAYCAALVLSISTSSGSSWLHQPSVYTAPPTQVSPVTSVTILNLQLEPLLCLITLHTHILNLCFPRTAVLFIWYSKQHTLYQ